MTALLDRLTGHRRAAAAAAAAILLLVVGAAAVAHHLPAASPQQPVRVAQEATSGTAPDPVPASSQSPRGPESLTAADQSALEATRAWLRGMAPVHPRTSPAHQLISGDARLQPDLYAAAVVRGLLTQDYRTPRADLLAWVQAESAPSAEPTVVGLIPQELRPQFAVASAQDGFDGPGPVPTQGVWDALAREHAYTTVVIGQVSEPVTWSAAVAAGQVADPGVTAREVDAQVTVHRAGGDHPRTATSSVAVTVNLEGPPVRDHYGLVAVVTYLAHPGQP